MLAASLRRRRAVLSGIAGLAQLFGLPVVPVLVIVIAGVIFMVWTGSYRSAERVQWLWRVCGGGRIDRMKASSWRRSPEAIAGHKPQHKKPGHCQDSARA